MENPDNGADFEKLASALTTFSLICLECELEVHREILASLMTSKDQKGSDTANAVVLQLHNMTLQKIDARLADLADHFPKGASAFSKLFDQWKAKRKI